MDHRLCAPMGALPVAAKASSLASGSPQDSFPSGDPVPRPVPSSVRLLSLAVRPRLPAALDGIAAGSTVERYLVLTSLPKCNRILTNSLAGPMLPP